MFPIEDYDDLRVNEIMPLLPELYDDELEMVAERERDGANRATILNRIAELLGEEEPAAAPAKKSAGQGGQGAGQEEHGEEERRQEDRSQEGCRRRRPLRRPRRRPAKKTAAAKKSAAKKAAPAKKSPAKKAGVAKKR